MTASIFVFVFNAKLKSPLHMYVDIDRLILREDQELIMIFHLLEATILS